MILAEFRQIWIEEAQSVGRFDDANTGGALLFNDLLPEGRHAGPMHLGPEMMFGVVTVEEPDPIVELVVTADAPRDWFVRVAAVMAVVTIQVGKAMTEIPKAEKEKDVMPIQDTQGNEGANKERDFRQPPISFPPIFTH